MVTIKSNKPVWPPLAMKNITCFVLQIMQLRVVAQRQNELQTLLLDWDWVLG